MTQTPKPDSHHQPPTAKPQSDPGATASGLIVTNTDPIRSFLLSATSGSGPDLSPELRDLASDLSSRTSVSYKSLRAIWSALPVGSRPPLYRLFAGSEFVFSSPKPREKSKELKARLRKLEELAERKAYAELVKDITPKKGTDEPFSSYKDQIGFGMHVMLIMFTGYLVGYAAFRALFNHSTVMNAAGGILGLVCVYRYWLSSQQYTIAQATESHPNPDSGGYQECTSLLRMPANSKLAFLCSPPSVLKEPVGPTSMGHRKSCLLFCKEQQLATRPPMRFPFRSPACSPLRSSVH